MNRNLAERIGENLRSRRKHKNMTLCDVAAKIGVSYQQMQKYEKGVNRISAAQLIVLANLFSCSLDELCGLPPSSRAIDKEMLCYHFSRIPSESMREKTIEIVAEIAALEA